MGGTVAKV